MILHLSSLDQDTYIRIIFSPTKPHFLFFFLVICGEEITCRWEDGSTKHIVGLFLTEKITEDYLDTNIVQPYFDNIASQGGLSIVAHPRNTWENWLSVESEFTADMWEVQWMSEPLAWTLDRGYNYVYSHDCSQTGNYHYQVEVASSGLQHYAKYFRFRRSQAKNTTGEPG